MKKILARIGFVLFGVVAAVLLVELTLKLSAPYDGFGAARELTQFRKNADTAQFFMIDSEFGFRPMLGTDLYNEYGTLTNSYSLRKKEGVSRVLFVGDSVTARGFIVDALKSLCGTDKIEYWNAGVESFNTVQEVNYYRRYNRAIKPDHVVLTFHMNDFETTPVSFVDGKGRLMVYAPNFPAKELNPWLFRNSRLYRMFLGLSKRNNESIDEVMLETRTSLRVLKNELEDAGIRFSVILLPFLKPESQWNAADGFSRKAMLEMMNADELCYYDLLGVVEQAMVDGVNVRESTGDDWHPSKELSLLIAEYLEREGLFFEEG